MQVDPLKYNAYGVKKPLGEKQDKIEQLELDGKRYYPKLKNGKWEFTLGVVDEWGAVVKH
mgnify:CR=1 FL=1